MTGCSAQARPRIVTVGEALVEIMRTERDKPLDRPAGLFGPYPSGAPAIFASAASRLGASVGFVGTVGEDPLGDCISDRLQVDGIDCSALRRAPDRVTGIALVAYASDGTRSFVFHLRQSAAALVAFEQLPPEYLAETQYLHVMGSSLATSESMRDACYEAARQVHAHGGKVSLDPNLRPELMGVERIRAVCAPILEMATIVLPSGSELLALTGASEPDEGVDHLLGLGVNVVALKRGDDGSTLFTPSGAEHVPAFCVTEVDPTGAGDCFDAALLVGLDEGWPLSEAGVFANAVGALATTRLGPMEGTFTRAQVFEFMASQGRAPSRA